MVKEYDMDIDHNPGSVDLRAANYIADCDDLIYLWPDGTWCRKEDLEEYLSFMSDDFEVRQVLAYAEHDNPCHTERLPRRTLTRWARVETGELQ